MYTDLIVVVIVLISIILGYRAGLVKTCLSALSYILSIIISFTVCPILASALMETPLHESLLEMVTEHIAETGTESLVFWNGYMESGVDMLTAGIAGTVTALIINVIAFVIVVILTKILLAVLAKVLNIITFIPVIKQCNRLGGIAIGAAIGIVIVYLVLAVMVGFAPMLSDSVVAEQISESYLTLYMYKNNVLVSWIGGIM